MATLVHNPDRSISQQLTAVVESLGKEATKLRNNLSSTLGEIFVASEPKFRAQDDKRETMQHLPTAKSRHIQIF